MDENTRSATTRTAMEWPALPDITQNDPLGEVKKVLYQGKIDALLTLKASEDAAMVAEAAADLEREKAHYAHYYTNTQAILNSYIDVAKGSIERARTGAEFVEKAASAVGVLYAGLLGLVFTVGGANFAANPLPMSGVVPVLFLGAAVVLAAVYRAVIVKEQGIAKPAPKGDLMNDQQEQLLTFIRWCNATVARRRGFLNTSVVSLALGIIFLPAPFLDISEGWTFISAAVGLSLLGITLWLNRD